MQVRNSKSNTLLTASLSICWHQSSCQLKCICLDTARCNAQVNEGYAIATGHCTNKYRNQREPQSQNILSSNRSRVIVTRYDAMELRTHPPCFGPSAHSTNSATPGADSCSRCLGPYLWRGLQRHLQDTIEWLVGEGFLRVPVEGE